MDFYFYSPVAFEKWDYNSSVKQGIGGSETSHVEMAWRLARRGHNVITYAPIKKSTKTEWRGTKWYPIEKASFKQKGVWILYRCPEMVDKFPIKSKRYSQQIWLMMQDWDYPNWTDKRIKNTDRIITLCKSHGRYTIDNHPLIGKLNNLWLTSNGAKIDLIEEIEKLNIKRNPKKIMYASSPDRGMKYALQVFQKAREYVPDIELHLFYGFNNLDKLIKGKPDSYLAKEKDEIVPLLKQPGVHFHGRVSQNELYKHWFSTGIWIYITNFFETSNITGMEAQAMGAIPVFSPIFAQGENIKHGVGIEGDAKAPLTLARAAAEVVRLVTQTQLQEQIRLEMMPWARKRFTWEVFVDQWILEAQGKRKEFEKKYEFPVQL